MIKRFYRSKSDIENLSRFRTAISTDIDNFDYRGVVVNKPWGYEYLMYENQYVAAWVLHLKRDHQTSLHCHPNKKTSLVVISGEVVCRTLEGWLVRKKGEGVIIDDGVFHSTRASSPDGAFIIEFESPPNKKDLVRLNDEYGREHQGYEGTTNMSKDIHAYEYIDFHDVFKVKHITKMLRGVSISLISRSQGDDVHNHIRKERADLLCLLKGKVHDGDGRIILSAGDAAQVSSLRLASRLVTFSDILYFTLSHGKAG